MRRKLPVVTVARWSVLSLSAQLTLSTLLTLSAPSTVHAQPGLGRLFNTPQERQAIDAARSKPAGAVTPAGGDLAGGAAALAPGMGQSMVQGMQQGTTQGTAPGMAQGVAPGMQPSPQSSLQSNPGMAPETRIGQAPDVVPDLPPNMPSTMSPAMQADMAAMARATRERNAAQSTAPGMVQPLQPQQLQQQPMPQMQPMQPMAGAAMTASAQPQAESGTEQLTMNGVLRGSNGRSTVWLNNQPQRGAANKFSNRDSKAVIVTLPSGKRVVLQPGQRYDLEDGRVKDVGQ